MKIVWALLMAIMLAGCGTQPVMETVGDQWIEVAAPCRELTVKLPQEAAAPVLQSSENGKLYLCDEYVLMLQTFPGGDLDATLRQVTGLPKQQLTCIETREESFKRYRCAWSAVGESGEQVGRVVILDDGNYHYTVSVMADSAAAGDLTQKWNEILGSASLSDIG